MIESIGAVSTDQQSQTQQASIGQQDLFELLLTELTYQDPLKPLDNQEFIARLAQFTSLEQTRQTKENFDVLLRMQTTSQAIGLLQRDVQVGDATQGQYGTVIAVDFEQGTPSLTLRFPDNTVLPNVSLSQVSLVRTPGVAQVSAGSQNIATPIVGEEQL